VSKAWCLKPGVQILVPKSWCPNPDNQGLVSRSWRPYPGVQSLVSKAWCPKPGVQSLVSKAWCPKPGVQSLVSKAWCPKPSVQNLVSILGERPSLSYSNDKCVSKPDLLLIYNSTRYIFSQYLAETGIQRGCGKPGRLKSVLPCSKLSLAQLRQLPTTRDGR